MCFFASLIGYPYIFLRRTKPVVTLPTMCSAVDGYIVVLSNKEQL